MVAKNIMKLSLGYLFIVLPYATPKNILETTNEYGTFQTLLGGLYAADLTATLSDNRNSFTVFAPTDEAFLKLFASLPNNISTCLLQPNNKGILTDILKYHVLSGKVYSYDLQDSMAITTLNGDDVTFDLSVGDQIHINESNITIPDIEASNGVIHVIDSVLFPSDIDVGAFIGTCQDIPEATISNDNFETLAAALDAADLVDTLSDPAGPFTVFAPTDEAFASLPDGLVACLLKPNNEGTLADILKYHVIEGKFLSSELNNDMATTTLNGDGVTIDLSDGVQINDSNVITPDIEVSNGVIHAIDSVLFPSNIDVNAILATCRDIPQSIVKNGNFGILATALDAANLVHTLSDPAGPFTVFAPTNTAFAALPDGLVTCLLEPNNQDTLADILKYHVIEGKVLSSDLSNDMTVITLNGDNVDVDPSNGVQVNDSNVITADVEVSNGVIHTIDSVLFPPDIDVNVIIATCRNILQTVVEFRNFDTLVTALRAADLINTLSEPTGPFTMFAPTDEAFASLPDGLVTCLLEPNNQNTLADILKYHIIERRILTSDLSNAMTVVTLNGDNVAVDLSDVIKINDAIVSTPDIEASNGVIHVIDSMLVPSDIDINAFLATCRDIPQTTLANGNFETLVTALGAADLVDTLSEPAGPFTVFAPTDEAFAALPDGLVSCLLEPNNKDTLADILKYHIIEGEVLSNIFALSMTATTLNGEAVAIYLSDGVKINDSAVSIPDIKASNGVIHVIDSVLVPSHININAFLAACRDIPQTAVANGNFGSLVTALGAADLVDTLSEPAGPFTVFAPTDEAFAALPDGLVNCLLEPNNKDTLADILKYHIIEGKLLSSDLSNDMEITTLNGNDLAIELSGSVEIGNSIVSTLDIEVSNGVIHAIDYVLVPSDIDLNPILATCRDIPQTIDAKGNLEILATIIDAADLVDTLSEPAGPFTVFAPTDKAFARFPEGFVTCLLESNSKDILVDILKYHIIEGNFLSSEFKNGMTLATLNGDDVAVDLSEDVTINDSIVSIPDLKVKNGVIHLIDALLVPSNVDFSRYLESCEATNSESAAAIVMKNTFSLIFGALLFIWL